MKPVPFFLLILIPLVMLGAEAFGDVLVMENGQVTEIGSTASLDIMLDEAPEGLSGYSINVSVANPGVATVSAISYPSWASLTQTSSLPASECRIKASDTGELVQSGATDIPIATVTLQGLAGGSTAVNLVINMMNDDSDDTMNPIISAGTFVVDAPTVVPVAAFTATPTSGALPLTVAFTDQSTNAPTSWSWDFGDGATSTVRNPGHQYTTDGVFTVVLTATNSAGSDEEVKTDYISVIPEPPVANFAKNTSLGQAPLSVQFNDTSTGGDPTSWAWDFENDGTIDSNEENPVFVYTMAGTYSVNLTVANAGGASNRVKMNGITVLAPAAPVANFTATPLSGMPPVFVQFTDTSVGNPTSWTWSFGDGGNSTEQNPSHIFSIPGIYSVNHSAANGGGASWLNRTGFIQVTSREPAPTVSDITPDTGINTTSITITNLAGMNFNTTCPPSVILNGTGFPDIVATGVNAVSSSRIQCTFHLTGQPPGKRNVVVSNPDGQTGMLDAGFTVTSPLIPHYAVFRSSPGSNWIFTDDLARVKYRDQYGTGTDKPLVGDFDNDGVMDRAVVRNGQWIVDLDMDRIVDSRSNFGIGTDIPLVADFNNDDVTDRAVFRNGQWIIDIDLDGDVDIRTKYGTTGDLPLVGDFNTDGVMDRAVFRTGQWIVDLDLDGDVDSRTNYGIPADIALVGFFGDDAILDRAVFRSGQWIIDYDFDGSVDVRQSFGIGGDRPLSWVTA